MLVAGTKAVTVGLETVKALDCLLSQWKDLVMVGCGMMERGIEHYPIYNLSEWIIGDAKKPRSRRLQPRSVDQEFGLGYIKSEM